MNISTDNGKFSINVDEIAEIDFDFNKEKATVVMSDGTVHHVTDVPDKPKASELRKIVTLLVEQPKSRAAFIDAIVDDIIQNG
jgi:hypothetical protein